MSFQANLFDDSIWAKLDTAKTKEEPPNWLSLCI